MRYVKKPLSFSMAILIFLSLLLSSLVMAAGADDEDPVEDTQTQTAACPSYSNNRDLIKMLPKIENHVNVHHGIVDNKDGTATAYFKTTVDCVRVSFSSYSYPVGTIPDSNGRPFEVQIHFDGESIEFPTAGNHEVTIDVPKCAPFQVDVYSGPLMLTIGTGGHAGAYVFALVNQNGNDCGATPTPTTPPTDPPTPTPTTPPTDPPTSTPTTPPTNPPTSTPTTPPTNPPTSTPTTPPTNPPTSTPTTPPTNPPTSTPTTPPTDPPTSTPTTPPTEPPSATPTVPPSDTPTLTPEPTTIIEVDEEEIPRGDGGGDDDDGPSGGITENTDQTVPIDKLPKTGEASPMPYYFIGSFVITAGLLTFRSAQKRRKQNLTS